MAKRQRCCQTLWEDDSDGSFAKYGGIDALMYLEERKCKMKNARHRRFLLSVKESLL